MENLDKDAIQIRMVDVLTNHPTISERGYDGDGNYQDLLRSYDVFESCCLILRPIDKSKKVGTKHASYGLKHVLEGMIGGYVSNGVAICALIDCGYTIKVGTSKRNVSFNMYESDYKELSNRAEAAKLARSLSVPK